MKKEILKLYNGSIDLNSLLVEKCIRENENVEVIYKGESMTLTPEELVNERVAVSKQSFESKKNPNGPKYKLFSYKWIPTVVEL